MESLECDQIDFVHNAKLYRQPVQVFKHRCYMAASVNQFHHSCRTILHTLQLTDGIVRKTSEEGVAVIEMAQYIVPHKFVSSSLLSPFSFRQFAVIHF